MKNKTKIALVIDSTTTVSQELINDYDIKVVSLNIHTALFDKKEADTTDEEILEQLNDLKNIKTSSPAPFDYINAYEELFKKGYEDIVVVPLSKGLSSTHQSALVAKNSIDEGDHVYILDTNTGNYGIANIVESVIFMLDNPETKVEDFVKQLEIRIKNCDLRFTLTELKHLVNGGRLSRIAGLMGSLLKIKPMIKFNDEGKLYLADKVLRTNVIINSFIEEVKKYASEFDHVYVKLVELNKEDVAKELEEEIKKIPGDIHLSTIHTVRPTFYIHVGNHGFGITVTAYND